MNNFEFDWFNLCGLDLKTFVSKRKAVNLEEGVQKTLAKWVLLSINYKDLSSDAISCGLCNIFIDNQCIGCPIEEDGHQGCLGTPYDKFHLAILGHDKRAEVRFALRELEYLKDLLNDVIDVEAYITEFKRYLGEQEVNVKS